MLQCTVIRLRLPLDFLRKSRYVFPCVSFSIGISRYVCPCVGVPLAFAEEVPLLLVFPVHVLESHLEVPLEVPLPAPLDAIPAQLLQFLIDFRLEKTNIIN